MEILCFLIDSTVLVYFETFVNIIEGIEPK